MFDIATLTGADLWLIGSQQVDAVAWRSLDGGATWAEAQRVAPRPGQASGFARFYFAGAFGGRLYLHAVDTEGPRSTSLVFDGARWTDGANLLPGASAVGWRPVVFAGRLVYQSPMPIAKAGAQLLAFDGQRASVPLATPISPRGLRCRPGLLQQKCCLGAFRVDDDRPEQSSARPP